MTTKRSASLLISISQAILAIYALYYIGHGWLPVSIIEKRVLYYITSSSPLLYKYQIDLGLILFFSSIIISNKNKNYVPRLILMTLILIIGYVGGIYISPVFFSFFSVPPLIALYCSVKANNLNLYSLLKHVALAIIIIEVLAILSSLHYFALGAFNNYTRDIMIKHRFIWSFIEWFSIILLPFYSFYLLAKLLLPRHVGHSRETATKLDYYQSRGNPQSKKYTIAAIVLSGLLSLIVVMLPHMPTVNALAKPISVDTYYYLKFIEEANTHGLDYALNHFKGFSRPIYFLLIFLASRIVDPVLLLDVLHPFFSIWLLSISCFIIARKHSGIKAAFLAAILTPPGHSAVAIIIGGFHANSIALPLALMLFSIEPHDYHKLLALSTIIGLLHPWTLAIYAISYTLYTFMTISGKNERTKQSVKRNGKKRITLKVFLIFTAVLAIIEIIDRLISSTSPSYSLMRTLNFLGLFPRNVFRAIELWTWGAEAYGLLYLLMPLSTPPPIHALLMSISPFLLFSNSLIIHRLILNTPLEINIAVTIASKDKTIIIAIVLFFLARTLEILTGITPLADMFQSYKQSIP